MATITFDDDEYNNEETKANIPLTDINKRFEDVSEAKSHNITFDDREDELDENKSIIDPTKNENEYSGTADYLTSKEFITKDLPRKTGLAVRSIAQGATAPLDLMAMPIRGGINLFRDEDNQIPPNGLGNQISGLLNLPTPETPSEMMINTAMEFGTGAGSISKLASKYANKNILTPNVSNSKTPVVNYLDNVGKSIPNQLGRDVGRQAIQGGAFGGAYEGIEQFGQEIIPNEFTRDVAKIGGGIGASLIAPSVGNKLLSSISSVGRNVKNIPKAFKPHTNSSKSEQIVDEIIQNKGINLTEFPVGIRNSLVSEVDSIISKGGDVNRVNINRLIDYKLTGTKPTVGTLNRDPAQVTAEQNLAKLAEGENGANSLASIKNQNNRIIVNTVDDMGAGVSKPTKEAGDEVFGLFSSINEKFKVQIRDLYKKALGSNGRDAWYDAVTFNKKVTQRLKDENLLNRVPKEIKEDLAGFLEDPKTFTVDAKSNFQSNVAEDMRTAMRTSKGSEYKALKEIRDELENVELGAGQNFGKEATQAIKDAKKASYEYNKMQDKIPALSDFRNPKVNSEDFFEKFFVRSKGDDFVSSFNALDNAGRQVIKNNLLGHIKRAMTGDTTNDFAKVSAKGLERVLKNIGKKKLEAVFSRDELLQIQALKRVAKADNFMPVGSAVNTSNTASALSKEFSNKLPFLNAYKNNKKVNQALDIDNAIKQATEQPPFPIGSFYDQRGIMDGLLSE